MITPTVTVYQAGRGYANGGYHGVQAITSRDPQSGICPLQESIQPFHKSCALGSFSRHRAGRKNQAGVDRLASPTSFEENDSLY